MDATHSPDRGSDPLRLLWPTLLRTIGSEDGLKRLKGRWARTRLKKASIDAAEASGRALGRGGPNLGREAFGLVWLSDRKQLGSSPRLSGSRD